MGQRIPGDPVGAGADLDHAALDEIRRLQVAGQPDIVAAVAALFADDGVRQIQQLSAAIVAHDGPALRVAAHTLKGSAAAVGARELQAVCQRLEQIGLADTVDGADELVTTLDAAFARTCAALERLTALGAEAG